MIFRRHYLLAFFMSYRGHALLWSCLLIPSFLTCGKIYFVFPVLFLWALMVPHKLPWLALLIGGVIQDTLLELPWGCHGIVYSLFLSIVLSQRPTLHNRSFLLRWTIFGIILSFCQSVMFAILHYNGQLSDLLEPCLYGIVIPWFSFPLLIQTTQNALMEHSKPHGP